MPNRLSQTNSPYLLQHQGNPVDWYPWGQEALDKAKAEDKPIFLSIGYAACHWCHVMAHESFEDSDVAAYMNAHFINIKVDREERPDIDGIYMDAVVALTGSGGWPMSVFLTPDGTPFTGGTYFPPQPRHNLPSFMQLLQHVVRLWEEEREKISEVGGQLLERIQGGKLPIGESGDLNAAHMDTAAMALAQNYDWQHGGWGRAPKFPQPMAIDFLLNRALKGDKMAQDMATHALQAMSQGGMYDVVGGGFARYSVDDRWLVPHFEKMLYDNAQLARAYLHSYLLTGDEQFRRVCEATLDFVVRELRDEAGGFYSSLDADSEGEEGKYYVWTLDEIKAVLADSDLFEAAYGVTEVGNFEGKIVLQRTQSDKELAATFGLESAAIQPQLDEAHAALLAARQKRTRPGTDDKVLTAWNGLMLAAFAEAGRYLHRDDYTQVARDNAEFLLSELYVDGRLLRSWRAGHAAHNGYLEDHAALILGLISLYQSDPDVRWFAAAQKVAGEMVAHFRNPEGGFFDTRDDHEELITRPKDLQDNATPSGNALAALALLQLHAYTGESSYYELAANSLGTIQGVAAKYPSAFALWLQALQFALAAGREIAIIGDPGAADTQALTEMIWAQYRPFDVLALSSYPSAAGAPALLEGRQLLDGKATAYVCRHFACQLPVTTVDALHEQLSQK